ncbi:TetR/AcrR family transcriptional regulator [Neobacillus sp.]|uniref:TetR/AcrR family transcriptional regulator n=1 Tax=Neobacillus sp. TaxID=2675273 RepID=UPI00289F0947|nr:TetR/AcrR family transcriptional regulator [Neobacillus sp.]
MLERPTDRRIIRTKRLIRDALTELMEEKGFEAITVRDLTEKADINRGTFYLHYRDKFDLLDQCEDEIINEIQKLTHKIDPKDALKFDGQKEPFPFIVYLFEYLQENSSFMKVALGPKGNASFQVKLKELIRRTFFQNILSKLKQEEMLVPVDFLIAYVSSAHLGVIQHWLESGMEKSPREMALILSRITLLGPRHVTGLNSKEL